MHNDTRTYLYEKPSFIPNIQSLYYDNLKASLDSHSKFKAHLQFIRVIHSFQTFVINKIKKNLNILFIILLFQQRQQQQQQHQREEKSHYTTYYITLHNNNSFICIQILYGDGGVN